MRFALSWAAREIADKNEIETNVTPLGDMLTLTKIDGLWSRLADEIGWNEAMRLAQFPHDFMKLIDPYGRTMMDQMRETFNSIGGMGRRDKTPAYLCIADDVCSSIGWIVAEDIVRDALMMVYGKMISTIHNDLPFSRDEFNVSWCFHSDGDISSIYPAIKQAGFDAVHGASVPYARMSTLVGKAGTAKLEFFGGVMTETLEEGRLSGELTRQIAILARRPNMVVCDDGGMDTLRQLEHELDACHQIALC
ncbi:MAG: hypothetical protein FWD41_03530 [Actinomycetia bacterium]|nr:hypothetical protein [Actinomycetes bacterium]